MAGLRRLTQEVSHIAGVPTKLGIAIKRGEFVNHVRRRGRVRGVNLAYCAKQRDLCKDVVLHLPWKHRAQNIRGQHPTGLGCVVLGHLPVKLTLVVLVHRLRNHPIRVQHPGRRFEQVDRLGLVGKVGQATQRS